MYYVYLKAIVDVSFSFNLKQKCQYINVVKMNINTQPHPNTADFRVKQ